MAWCTSNTVGCDISLDVSLFTGADGELYLSITTRGFPDQNIVTVLPPGEQQLIDLEDVINEFAARYANTNERHKLADLLEATAKRLRKGK